MTKLEPCTMCKVCDKIMFFSDDTSITILEALASKSIDERLSRSNVNSVQAANF